MDNVAVSHVTHKPTRAQALRDKVDIDLAQNDEGDDIAAVLLANDVEFEADWSTVFPHWLVATVEGRIVGCCQILVSKPIGYIEFLFVHPETPFKLRAIALRKLLLGGISTLHRAGCQYVGGAVDTKNKKFANVLADLKFFRAGSADLLVKRLR